MRAVDQAASDWHKRFVGVMAHLRERGWTRAFMMRGSLLIAPGMIVTPDRRMPPLVAHNDN